MKRFVSSKRFEAATAAGVLFLALASGCAIPISTEFSLIADSGGDWYTIENGNLVG